MSGPFSAVNGIQIVDGELLVPASGPWTLDCRLATAQPVTGSITVTIGNLTLVGNAYRSNTYGGQTSIRAVAGAGGWRTAIKPQGYGNSSGVQLSTILSDAAQACGETVNVPNDTSVGNAFARVAFASSVASDVLQQVVSLGLIPAWYVDVTGKTQAAAWPSTTVASPFTPTSQRPDHGVIVVATEDYASWLPGASFSSTLLDQSYTCAGVHYVWTPDGQFRLDVLTMTDAGVDRVGGPLGSIVDKQTAPMRFFGRYGYTMSNPTSSTVDGEPVNSKLGLPELKNVPICCWSVGTFTPESGQPCHIMFVDGDPTQPVCVWTSTPDGTNPVARLGDQIQAFLPPTLPCTVTVSGVPSPGIITAAAPISGVITQGSQVANVK